MTLLRPHHALGLVALGLLVAVGCGTDASDEGGTGSIRPSHPSLNASPSAAASKSALDSQVFVTSIDRSGAPTFVFASRSNVVRRRSTTPERAALVHLAALAPRYRLPRAALDSAVITQVSDVGEGGVVVVLRQKIGGIEVVERDVKVLMDESLSLVAVGGSLHPAGFSSTKLGRFVLAEKDAVDRALAALHPASNGSARLLEPARSKRVWFPIGERLVPAWSVELFAQAPDRTDDDAYRMIVAADDGRILRKTNLRQSATFQYRVYADSSGRYTPMDGPIADLTPHPTGTAVGTRLSFVAPNLVSLDGFNATRDPWLAAGATETRGNNVDAYTDDGADGFSSGDLRASVTAPGVFDRTYEAAAEPNSSANQKMAAITNAFFVTNWLHDDWYDVGFDEAAGNAQVSNYGRGGADAKDGDPLLVEVQDRISAGAIDNANATTPGDGRSPRLQFYVWSPAEDASLEFSGNGGVKVGFAEFGPQSFERSGTLAVANDGVATTTDACQTLVGNVSGRVVIVDRGNCSYEQKVRNAQSAGAVGVIVVNNTNASLGTMPDDAAVSGVTIPSVLLGQQRGNELKASLITNPALTAKLTRTAARRRDGALDATIVAHEWGHYLHHRLVACGNEQCAAESEGWGDFVAMHMVLRPGDGLDGTYGLGQYASASLSSDAAYFGTRRFPYSVDFQKNGLTFKHIAEGEALPAVPMNEASGGPNSEVHNAGEVWTSMLWEAYIALQKRAPAAYTFDEARKRMASYVVTGMKLAPTNPTYTEQRDAIIAAAIARDAADATAIAAAFARRGAGTCAVSPARDSSNFTGVVETFNVVANASIASVTLDDAALSCDSDGILDAGETGRVIVRIENKGPAPLAGASITVSSRLAGTSYPKGATATVPTVEGFASLDVPVEIALAAGTTLLDVKVDLTSRGGCTEQSSASLIRRANVDEHANASTTDDVEALSTAWTSQDLDGHAFAATAWRRVEITPGTRAWHGDDTGVPSDTALTSPALVVGTGSLRIAFKHRHAFERSDGTNWDGSVVEISTDGGTTWADAATLATPSYGGVIGDVGNGAINTLEGRHGYVGTSAGYPEFVTETLDFGTELAGKTVKVRFRIGTDDAGGADGWDIDDIAVTGIMNEPFAKFVAEDGVCTNIPTANAGVDQAVAGGATVTLDGTASRAKNAEATLAFAWQQTAGPSVILSEAGATKPTFAAPVVTKAEKLSFELTVRDGLSSATDSVDVTVEPGPGTGGGSDVAPGNAGDAEGSDGSGCRFAPAERGARSAGSMFGGSVFVIALAALFRRRRARFGSPTTGSA